MRGLLVLRGRVVGAIDLDEDEARRVIGLLYDIEPGNAGFLDAVARVFERSRLKGFHALRFHLNVDVNNEHGPKFRSDPTLCLAQCFISPMWTAPAAGNAGCSMNRLGRREDQPEKPGSAVEVHGQTHFLIPAVRCDRSTDWLPISTGA